MALVKFGGGIIQMSGSIAGNTFARNRYGNYARARTKPVNPKSSLQVKIRAAIAYLTEYWADTLEPAQREAWATYATGVAMKNKLGETIKLSGFNHFIRSNSIRVYTNLAVIAAGPAENELPAHDPTFAVGGAVDSQTLCYTLDAGMDWAKEDGSFIYLFQGRPQNPQRNFFAGPWRYNGNLVGIAPGGIVPPHCFAATFPIALGQKQWVYARIQRADGRLSERFQADCLVAASS